MVAESVFLWGTGSLVVAVIALVLLLYYLVVCVTWHDCNIRL